MVQLPAHDLVAAHCRQLEASDKQQLATFDEFWESYRWACIDMPAVDIRNLIRQGSAGSRQAAAGGGGVRRVPTDSRHGRDRRGASDRRHQAHRRTRDCLRATCKRLAGRAFQFAIRIDSIRFVMRIDSNRFVCKKNRPFDSLVVMQFFLVYLLYSLSQKIS